MPVQKRPDSKNKVAIDKNKGIKFDNAQVFLIMTELRYCITFLLKQNPEK